MNALISQFADYLVQCKDWITQRWIEAVELEREPVRESTNEITYVQLVDHLPGLLHDLAERLKATLKGETQAEIRHAHRHGKLRVEQGYGLRGLILESGITRQILSIDCVDRFAQDTPEFDAHSRRVAERIIHAFINDMLEGSAEQFTEELRRQKEVAEKANEAKDRFLGTLSHELRTPLNPVLMWACATQKEQHLEPQMREDLRMVCRNVELEACLIDDLLDLTRITQGKLHLNLQPCTADSLLHHALDIVRTQMESKGLHVSVELKATNHHIMADPTRIQQVFWNLLKNAQKFTPEGGRISVRSYDSAPGVVAFEISDSGRGIDPAFMPKLFSAFEQGGARGEGLGLGLAICKAVVQAHGGKISAASKGPGQGTVFTVQLNTIAPQVEPVPVVRKPATRPVRKSRILIVEDDEHTGIILSKLLKRGGHEVATATTVRSALEILRKQEFDLLVSDVGLPDGTGFQVMRELAKVGNAKGIALSGYGMEDDLKRSSAAGFSAHLTKPIRAEDLQEAIQQVTSET